MNLDSFVLFIFRYYYFFVNVNINFSSQMYTDHKVVANSDMQYYNLQYFYLTIKTFNDLIKFFFSISSSALLGNSTLYE